jgi:hypothetical protein
MKSFEKNFTPKEILSQRMCREAEDNLVVHCKNNMNHNALFGVIAPFAIANTIMMDTPKSFAFQIFLSLCLPRECLILSALGEIWHVVKSEISCILHTILYVIYANTRSEIVLAKREQIHYV